MQSTEEQQKALARLEMPVVPGASAGGILLVLDLLFHPMKDLLHMVVVC